MLGRADTSYIQRWPAIRDSRGQPFRPHDSSLAEGFPHSKVETKAYAGAGQSVSGWRCTIRTSNLSPGSRLRCIQPYSTSPYAKDALVQRLSKLCFATCCTMSSTQGSDGAVLVWACGLVHQTGVFPARRQMGQKCPFGGGVGKCMARNRCAPPVTRSAITGSALLGSSVSGGRCSGSLAHRARC
jgi:hypothetical protein